MKKINSIFDLTKIIQWYEQSLKKIVFLLLVLVFFTLTVVYIPFLNVFITPSVGFGILIIVWYILFSPNTKMLVYISLILIGIACVATIFGIDALWNGISQFLFIIIIFILINYLKNEKVDDER